MTTTEATNGPATSLDELVERVDTIAADMNRTPVLSIVRGLMNETGLRRARSTMADAPDRLGNDLESLRVAQEAERVAREGYDAALAEASWMLDDRFETEGNKTYLAADSPLAEDADIAVRAMTRRQVTADQRRAWVAAEAAKQPAVAKAAAALHEATEGVGAARDAVEVSRARLAVARRDVDAAIAELEALCLAIPASMKAESPR